MEWRPARICHQPAVASWLRGEQGWQIFQKQFCEFHGDREFMQIRFADGLEPDGPFCRIETEEREGFATVQLEEVFQFHAHRTDYRSHPTLKIAQPAESAERLRIISRHPIRCPQIAGFENAVPLVLQKMRDGVMHWEPIHSLG